MKYRQLAAPQAGYEGERPDGKPVAHMLEIASFTMLAAARQVPGRAVGGGKWVPTSMDVSRGFSRYAWSGGSLQ
jgi:hypothetical protein